MTEHKKYRVCRADELEFIDESVEISETSTEHAAEKFAEIAFSDFWWEDAGSDLNILVKAEDGSIDGFACSVEFSPVFYVKRKENEE